MLGVGAGLVPPGEVVLAEVGGPAGLDGAEEENVRDLLFLGGGRIKQGDGAGDGLRGIEREQNLAEFAIEVLGLAGVKRIEFGEDGFGSLASWLALAGHGDFDHAELLKLKVLGEGSHGEFGERGEQIVLRIASAETGEGEEGFDCSLGAGFGKRAWISTARPAMGGSIARTGSVAEETVGAVEMRPGSFNGGGILVGLECLEFVAEVAGFCAVAIVEIGGNGGERAAVGHAVEVGLGVASARW